MAINKNHEFEDMNGIKCAVVERNLSPARLEFLKDLLEFNGFTTVVVTSPPPKAAAPKPAAPAVPAAEVAPLPVAEPTPLPPPAPELFTLGVTDSTFNATNAVFGRLLRTKYGRVVTLAYWQQKEAISQDEVPYFQKKA